MPRAVGKPKSVRTPRAEAETGSPGDLYVSSLARVALDGQILGQDRALETLAKALGSGHFPHAWIFHGPRGTGKCTAALRVASVIVDPLSGDASEQSVFQTYILQALHFCAREHIQMFGSFAPNLLGRAQIENCAIASRTIFQSRFCAST